MGLISTGPVVICGIQLGGPVTPRYRGRLDFDKLSARGDGASLQEYSPIRPKGVDVPYGEITRRFGGDYIGWRQGSDIYIAADRKGKPLSEVQRDAVYLHEVSAGHNHFRSDAEAQRLAENKAAVLAKKDARYVPLLEEVRAQAERLGFN